MQRTQQEGVRNFLSEDKKVSVGKRLGCDLYKPVEFSDFSRNIERSQLVANRNAAEKMDESGHTARVDDSLNK